MTYSIVARDHATGQLGVAVQSHYLGVGPIVPWADAGVGAVATQATVLVDYGPRALQGLRTGSAPADVLASLVAEDDGQAVRQVAIVDATGAVAVHTGDRCIPHAGHATTEGCVAQANMMRDPGVPDAMITAYVQTEGTLAERLLAALDAAQATGGDIRGQQSAALLVVAGTAGTEPWHGRTIDVRVEDAARPLEELRRLHTLHRAYATTEAADELLSQGDAEGALAGYLAAVEQAPDVTELRYWAAISMADAGRTDEARRWLADVIAREPAWAELTRRIATVGLLQTAPEDILPPGVA